MWSNLLVFLILLIASACAPVKETVVPVREPVKERVVLLPDASGKVGQLTVTTEGGAKTLTVANTILEISGTGKGLSDPREIDQSEIDSLFNESGKALPSEPVSFLLYFLHDSTELTPESRAYIPEVVSLFTKRDFYEISIIGHTDTTGKDEYNMSLSSARAEAVREALLSQGMNGRIELSYHGKRDPLIPTGDNVREPRNRRVEIVVK